MDKDFYTPAPIYLRFTDDIYADIERGYSTFKGGSKLSGLCAWTTPFSLRCNMYENANGEEVSLSEIEEYKDMLLKNTYGSYSSNEECYIITGDYAGRGNDGVLLTNIDVIDTI